MNKLSIIECDNCKVEMQVWDDRLEWNENNNKLYWKTEYQCPHCNKIGILTIEYRKSNNKWEWIK